MIAERFKKAFEGVAMYAIYAAPILLFVFPVLARVEPETASPWGLFGILYALLALFAWRALAIPNSRLFFASAFVALVAEAAWSATHLRDRTARYRGSALHDLRAVLSRRTHRRATDAATARTAMGRRRSGPGESRHAALPRRGSAKRGGIVGHGVPAGAAQRRIVRRERGRPSARAVGRGQSPVVARAWSVVGQRCRSRRPHAVVDRAGWLDARDARWPCLGAPRNDASGRKG